jgi:hypothetical protein
MRECARIENNEIYSLLLSIMNALNQLILGVALQREQMVAGRVR